MAFAIIEKWPIKKGLSKSQCMDCIKSGHCREVAASKGSNVFIAVIFKSACEILCCYF